jgi:hypothetical protein
MLLPAMEELEVKLGIGTGASQESVCSLMVKILTMGIGHALLLYSTVSVRYSVLWKP